MKKRLLRKLSSLALSLLLVLALSACSTPDNNNNSTNNSTASGAGSEKESIASTDEITSEDTTAKPEVEHSVASSDPTPVTSPDTTVSQSTSSVAENNISREKAKSIALKDAGLKEANIYDLEIELDREKGTLHYDVSFESNGRDYDYEINAKTGKIISVEKPNATSSKAKISKEKAKTTALTHAGVKSGDISHYEVELEKDNGIWKYEISFNSGNVEYEYTINAETGKIIKSEKDIDD